MALTAANVRVGVTGAVYAAPTGTTLPTDIATALNVAFEDVGYISEDGVTTSTSADVTDIQAWQDGAIVRKIQTSHDFTLSFTMIETNEKSLELYFGNYTAGGVGDGVIEIDGSQGWRGCFVINVVDDASNMFRIVVPDGQVTERDDFSIVNGAAMSYGVTITCYPDASNVKAYVYVDTAGAS